MSLTRQQYNEVLEAIESCDGIKKDAAYLLDLNYKTFHSRWVRGRARWGDEIAYDDTLDVGCGEESLSEFTVESPELPSGEMEVEELIEHRKNRFNKQREALQAREWMRFDMNFDGPYALAFVGDPHMDDNGCNWPLLDHHIDIIRNSEGMFGICLGDYTNNWSGYLSQKIHPHQEYRHRRQSAIDGTVNREVDEVHTESPAECGEQYSGRYASGDGVAPRDPPVRDDRVEQAKADHDDQRRDEPAQPLEQSGEALKSRPSGHGRDVCGERNAGP